MHHIPAQHAIVSILQ